MLFNMLLQCSLIGDGKWIQSFLRLNDDGSWFCYQWYTRIKKSDKKYPIFRQACVLLNNGTALGITVDVMFGNAD